MHELLLLLNIALYLVLGYLLVFIPLVWLITRNEPNMRIFLDWALKPVLWPLQPFGLKIERAATESKMPSSEDREQQVESGATASPTRLFRSIRAAKEYLVDRIVAEAERESMPLSDIERKMLYFSETDWAPPGILEVAAEFERDYDDTAYEQKIAALVRNLEARATPEEQEEWGDALIKLSEGDHYLQILIDYDSILPESRQPPSGKLASWLPAMDAPVNRPPGDLRRLILIGLGFGAVLMIAAAIAAMTR